MAGAVDPPAINRVVGEMLTFEESLLARVIVTPAPGAGMPKVTGKGTTWFGVSFMLPGRMIGPVATIVLVNWKTAGMPSPVTIADTVYDPKVPFAVNTGEVAIPALLVIADTVLWPPANNPLGPVVGALKMTVTPLTGLCWESTTVAERGEANGVLINAL